MQIELEEKMEVQSKLDVFHVDPEFEAHEAEWAAIKKEVLGEESDDGDGSGSGSEEDSSDEDSDAEGALPPPPPGKETLVCPPAPYSLLRGRAAIDLSSPGCPSGCLQIAAQLRVRLCPAEPVVVAVL